MSSKLAIAYNIKRKNQKSGMAEAPSESEPMADHEEHYGSIADAILAKKRKAKMADGGMVDLEENSEEHGNLEDDLSFDAIEKEQYDDSQISSQPMGSNEKGDEREDSQENQLDMVDAIRKRMKARRAE